MSMVAVIPARAGSKGIPNKNMKLLKGLPLIGWTLMSAKEAKSINSIIVTTDDPKIAKYVDDRGFSVQERPPYLAKDNVHAVRPVIDTLADFKAHGKWDHVVMLLPTSPFRSCLDIDAAYNLLISSPGADSIIGVRELGNPVSIRTIEDGYLKQVIKKSSQTQRQDIAPAYMVNGAIFMTKVKTLAESGTFHTKFAIPFVMDEKSSIDINTPEDLEKAENI